jgi:hypothetical protein
VRLIGEQHVREDLGFIPSFADWGRLIAPQAWMLRGNPLDESTTTAMESPAPAGEDIPGRSRHTVDQRGRVAI